LDNPRLAKLSLNDRLALAGLRTPLELATVPTEWLVPQQLSVDRARLCWRPTRPSAGIPPVTYAYTKRAPGPGLLEQFVALGDATDDAILAYARQWGVLVICAHGLPASHSERCRPLALPRRHAYIFWEPLASWRFFARQARRILDIAAHTHNGEVVKSPIASQLLTMPPSPTARTPPAARPRREKPLRWERLLYPLHERKNIFEQWVAELMQPTPVEGRPRGPWATLTFQRACVAYAVNQWLDWGRARPQVEWDGATPTIALTTGGLLPMYVDRLAGALALQLAYAVASTEGVATCFACGRFYTPTRRPAAGRRSFCPSCGVRAAWRTSKRIARGSFGEKVRE
jgi:hypothetical protein